MQITELMRKKSYSTLKRNSQLYLSLFDVFQQLADYPYAVVKGEALSIQAYGGLGYRNSHDIDFLTCKAALPQICKVLRENGFSQKIRTKNGWRDLTKMEKMIYINSHEIPPFRRIEKETGDVTEVDVNVDVIWGESRRKNINIEDWMKRRIDMEIYGINVKVLALDDAFAQMCLHHYREMNSIYTLRLKNPISVAMFQDVYMFYLLHYQDKPEYLLELAKTYNIKPYLYYLLFFSALLFKNEALNELLNLLITEEGVSLLDCYGLSELERKKWKVDFFTRLNNKNIFQLIEKDLNPNDIDKVNKILTVYLD